jgi:hypothetical protein
MPSHTGLRWSEADPNKAVGVTGVVRLIVRAWDDRTAPARAIDVVRETSLDVANGAGAAVLSVEPPD